MITHLSAVTSSLQNTSLCTTLTIYTSYQDITLLLFLTVLIVVNTIWQKLLTKIISWLIGKIAFLMCALSSIHNYRVEYPNITLGKWTFVINHYDIKAYIV